MCFPALFPLQQSALMHSTVQSCLHIDFTAVCQLCVVIHCCSCELVLGLELIDHNLSCQDCAAMRSPAHACPCLVVLLRCNVVPTCRFVAGYCPPEFYETALASLTEYDMNTAAEVFVYGLILAEVVGFSTLCSANDPQYASHMANGAWDSWVQVSGLASTHK